MSLIKTELYPEVSSGCLFPYAAARGRDIYSVSVRVTLCVGGAFVFVTASRDAIGVAVRVAGIDRDARYSSGPVEGASGHG